MVTSVAYPIGAHWCWATEGWLHKNGFRDFAGAGVVHLSGGIIALVGEYIDIIIQLFLVMKCR